jgi:hypothetical protein
MSKPLGQALGASKSARACVHRVREHETFREHGAYPKNSLPAPQLGVVLPALKSLVHFAGAARTQSERL